MARTNLLARAAAGADKLQEAAEDYYDQANPTRTYFREQETDRMVDAMKLFDVLQKGKIRKVGARFSGEQIGRGLQGAGVLDRRQVQETKEVRPG